VRHIDLPHRVRCIDVSYDGRLCTIAGGQEVRVFEGGSMTQRALVTTQQSVASASLCPESCSIVCGGEDMWAYLMDYPTGKVKQVWHCISPRHMLLQDSQTCGKYIGCCRLCECGKLHKSSAPISVTRYSKVRVGAVLCCWPCCSCYMRSVTTPTSMRQG
jgi:hypothetical protein